MAHPDEQRRERTVQNDVPQKNGRDEFKQFLLWRKRRMAAGSDHLDPVRKEEVIDEDSQNSRLDRQADIPFNRPNSRELNVRRRRPEIKKLRELLNILPLQ